MTYLFESKLPETKSIQLGLKYVYGINASKALVICKKLGFSQNFKLKNLSINQTSQVIKLVESLGFIITNDLKRFKLLEKKRLVLIKSYRGLRAKKGFPVRGQRTHTNAKTCKKIR